MTHDNLVYWAGPSALSFIRENGLHPDHVTAMAGAAGGPKWLVLGQLDRALFSTWYRGRNKPLYLIGSSSGAWRFAAVCQNDPVAGVDRFQEAYVNQRYESEPSAREISREAAKIQKHLFGKNGKKEILAHPYLRLNVMAVRCRGPAKSDNKAVQGLGMLIAVLCNTIRRKWMGLFFERALFHDPRDVSPFYNMSEFPIRRIPFTEENIERGLLASGSIPMLMHGVRDIPGAIPGVYRDGGLIDYHMDVPLSGQDGIALFPHYTNRIIPGWLDKKLTWRKPAPGHMDRVLLVAPSDRFLEKLPYGKIPDRDDFHLFQGKDAERIAYWLRAGELGKRIAEEFLETVNTDRIKEKVGLMPWMRKQP